MMAQCCRDGEEVKATILRESVQRLGLCTPACSAITKCGSYRQTANQNQEQIPRRYYCP